MTIGSFIAALLRWKGRTPSPDYFREVIGSILTNDMARIFGQTEHVDFFTNFYLDAFVCSIRRWLQSSEVMPARYLQRFAETVCGRRVGLCTEKVP